MTTSNFELRLCTPADAKLLSLMACGAFMEAFADDLAANDLLLHCQNNNSPDAFDKYLRMANAFVWTANLVETGVPVGYILTCEPELPEEYIQPGDYELKRIYLFHRFQGTGIGRALMDKAVAITRELGRTRLLLGVYSENHTAVQFYERAGFTKIGVRKFQVGNAIHDDFILGRDV